MHVKIDRLEQLILASSKKSPYVPPHARRVFKPNIRSSDGETVIFKREGKCQPLPTLVVSIRTSRLHLTQLKTQYSKNLTISIMGIFSWKLLQVEVVFDYKQSRDPRRVQLTETKLRKGVMCWWRNLQASKVSGYSQNHKVG